jgi:hypothetical protein
VIRREGQRDDVGEGATSGDIALKTGAASPELCDFISLVMGPSAPLGQVKNYSPNT